MTDYETQDEPVESLDSIEMEFLERDTIEVSGYDGDGNFWKEYFKHDRSDLVDKLEDE